MDDLDRLYLELVESLAERGKGLGEPVRVRELHEELIPYRRVRERVGFRSNGDYQATLSRLLSGERGYLRADSAIQESVSEALSAPVPDARRFRAFPDAEVRLDPDEVPLPGDTRYAPPEVRKRAARSSRAMGPERDSKPDGGRARGETDEDVETSAAFPPSSGPSVAGEASPEWDEDAESDIGRPSPAPAAPDGDDERPDSGAGPVHGEIAPEDGEAGTSAARSTCPACGDDFPGRPIRYCPYCGYGPIEASCAACGTPLRQDWKYCPECGRDRGFEPSNSA